MIETEAITPAGESIVWLDVAGQRVLVAEHQLSPMFWMYAWGEQANRLYLNFCPALPTGAITEFAKWLAAPPMDVGAIRARGVYLAVVRTRAEQFRDVVRARRRRAALADELPDEPDTAPATATATGARAPGEFVPIPERP